jgi:tetratricopeptide (TPR) repeat protein
MAYTFAVFALAQPLRASLVPTNRNTMTRPSLSLTLFGITVLVAVLGIYLPGLNNELLFDDLRLTEGAIFGPYGSLLDFKQRMLSYGSFVWVEALLGSGWWKQRLVNIALHLGTVACLYALLRDLLANTRFPEDFEAQQHFGMSRTAALQVGVALFAVNPMAVYAVAYLMQRSIVMATLFSVLACWLFVRGLLTRRAYWLALSFLSYVAAVLSKEHAAPIVAMAIPLYIYLRRPAWKSLALVAGAALVLLAAIAAVFLGFYDNLIGKLFDPRSIDFAKQLELLSPGITQRMYPLSVLNEAALFFAYGFLWFFPNVLWMSLDLRPAFPLSFTAFPQILGAMGYIALLSASAWVLLRKQGAVRLVALCLLFPVLLFVTEFATVWVQDPFVLYRSYLWAIGFPGLVAIALTGFKPRTIYMGGLMVAILFSLLALERVMSLKTEYSAWSDAAEKIDLKAPANAVGRWRPYLNLGAYHLDRGSLAQAVKEFTTAEALGDLHGAARFNIGVVLQKQNKHAEALATFAEAEKRGNTDHSLYYHRGESYFAQGNFALAYQSLAQSLDALAKMAPTSDTPKLQEALQMRRAEAAIGANQYDVAISDFTALLQTSPGNPRLLLGLGMAQVGKGDTRAAIALFNQLISNKPSAPAYYGRAMAYHTAGQQANSLKDLDQAIALDPRNPRYPQMRAMVAAPKK